jgi:hypothetical protein
MILELLVMATIIIVAMFALAAKIDSEEDSKKD